MWNECMCYCEMIFWGIFGRGAWCDGRGTCLLECLNDTGLPRCWDLRYALLPLLSVFSRLRPAEPPSHQRDAPILLARIIQTLLSPCRCGRGLRSRNVREGLEKPPGRVRSRRTGEPRVPPPRRRGRGGRGSAPGAPPVPPQAAAAAPAGRGRCRCPSLGASPPAAAGSRRRLARPGGAGSGSGAGRRGEEAGSPSPAAGSSPRPPRLRPLRRAHGRACPRRRCRSGGAGGRPRSPGSPSPARPAGRRRRRRAAGAGKPRRPRRTRGRGAEPGGTALPRPRGRTGGSQRRNQVRGRQRVRGASMAPGRVWFWGFFGVFRKEKRVFAGGRGAGPVRGAARPGLTYMGTAGSARGGGHGRGQQRPAGRRSRGLRAATPGPR